LHAGYTVRRKSLHFRSYEEVAKKFAKLLGMDPWLINPMAASCGELDAGSAAGLECVQTQADAMLTKVRRKFKEYGINEKPFVVVKADAGGMGAGVLTVRDAREIDAERVHRADAPADVPGVTGADRRRAHRRIHDAVAEPVVMMIDRYVVGGFYRVHADRNADESLCAPGSRYVPLAFAGSSLLPKPGGKPGASAPNRFYMYGVIGRLAMVAASYEMEAPTPTPRATIDAL
jgi:glutamate--cysteine ligase